MEVENLEVAEVTDAGWKLLQKIGLQHLPYHTAGWECDEISMLGHHEYFNNVVQCGAWIWSEPVWYDIDLQGRKVH